MVKYRLVCLVKVLSKIHTILIEKKKGGSHVQGHDLPHVCVGGEELGTCGVSITSINSVCTHFHALYSFHKKNSTSFHILINTEKVH